MAKGSQLSQLKTAINQAGLSRQPQPGKKRKRTTPDDRDKEKKAEKLKEIHKKLNPFDTKVTKLKHDVGGRKIIGTVGRPAKSKQAGLEQRKKTLLKEYEDKDRAGGIVDRRFGENDPSMNPEERMLERFTRERQRASKGIAFNLDDEDELTHYGQSLSKLDDFDNVGLGLDDEEDENIGQIDGRTVQNSHFGGFGDEEDEEDSNGEPERKKSKAEVMAEVIAKSKDYKFARQAQQQEDDDLRHQLDENLDSIRSLLLAPDPAMVAEAPLEKALMEDDDQEYDQFVRELAFEKRAKPKDRTKTEEEIALEEKEALEKAERKRIRRMNGEDENSDDEEGGKKGRKRQRVVGGDDLEDDFVGEDAAWDGLGAGLREDAQVSAEASGSEDGEDVNEGEDDEDEEEGDDEDAGEFMSASDDSEAEVEEGESEALVASSKKNGSRPKSSQKPGKDLPFVFPCPSTHDEFLDIVDGVEDEQVPTVVQRIRALHHPSLAEDNKFKLQALTGVLIDHILYITSPPTPRFTLLASLIPHLFALTKQYPSQSAEHFVAKLNLMHKNLKRGLSQGATAPDAKTWPGLPELSLLRVIGLLWPTSDMNHQVVSPTRLLMGAYLGLCRVRSLQDIASGLFLCTLFSQYEELSKRLVPEAINFLINTVLHLAPHMFKDAASLPGSFPAPDFRTERCLPLALDHRKAKKLALTRPNLSKIICEDLNDSEQTKVALLGLSLELIGRFADMYKGLEGFVELYQPIVDVIATIEPKRLPADLSAKLSLQHDVLARLLKFARQSRRPLRLQAHKPIPIPSYVPKFEQSSSNYLRNRDPDHERNEAAKLRKQYKQEKKGAIRELRKDAHFLAAEQQKKQKEKDKQYNDRMKRVYGSIESERAEEKAMEREKAKEKKRSGRK